MVAVADFQNNQLAVRGQWIWTIYLSICRKSTRPFEQPPKAVKEKDGVFTASCQDGDAAPIFDLDAHDEVTAGFFLGSIPRA